MNRQGMFPPIAMTVDRQIMLVALLGGRDAVLILEESEFVSETECPPEKLETWLEESWIQYDIIKVLEGVTKCGRWPMILTTQVANSVKWRLFTPARRLIIQEAEQRRFDSICNHVAARNWVEVADEIIKSIDRLTVACAARQLPTVEVKHIWMALWPAILALAVARPGHGSEHMRTLLASMRAFNEAYRRRDADQRAQAKYAEAGLNARRALSRNHNPALDGFPELVEASREVCSRETAQYLLGDVCLSYDDYLDALSMIARDRANPEDVPNPPARVRAALARARRAKSRVDRTHWMPLTEDQASHLQASVDLESSVCTDIDWERGKRDLGLPEDQTLAVEARLEGISLQSSEELDSLGWSAQRQEAVRRSLEPDRQWGTKLRRRFLAYSPVKARPRKQPKTSLKNPSKNLS
jgi:hypothetical protein